MPYRAHGHRRGTTPRHCPAERPEASLINKKGPRRGEPEKPSRPPTCLSRTSRASQNVTVQLDPQLGICFGQGTPDIRCYHVQIFFGQLPRYSRFYCSRLIEGPKSTMGPLTRRLRSRFSWVSIARKAASARSLLSIFPSALNCKYSP